MITVFNVANSNRRARFKAALLCCTALAIPASPALAATPIQLPPPIAHTTSPDTLRVLTYNTWLDRYANKLTDLNGFMQSGDYDLIGMQESQSASTNYKTAWPDILKAAGLGTYTSSVQGDTSILSRLSGTFAAGNPITTSGHSNMTTITLDASSNRPQFIFASTHLQYNDPPNLRMPQAQMIGTWAKTQTMPVLLVGDFNAGDVSERGLNRATQIALMLPTAKKNTYYHTLLTQCATAADPINGAQNLENYLNGVAGARAPVFVDETYPVLDNLPVTMNVLKKSFILIQRPSEREHFAPLAANDGITTWTSQWADSTNTWASWDHLKLDHFLVSRPFGKWWTLKDDPADAYLGVLSKVDRVQYTDGTSDTISDHDLVAHTMRWIGPILQNMTVGTKSLVRLVWNAQASTFTENGGVFALSRNNMRTDVYLGQIADDSGNPTMTGLTLAQKETVLNCASTDATLQAAIQSYCIDDHSLVGETLVNDKGIVAVTEDLALGGPAASLRLGNGTLRIDGTAMTTLNRPVSLEAGDGTIAISEATNVVTVPTVITGAGGLHKAGAGSLVLGAKETYTGPTVVDGGLLRVDGSIATASTVNAGGTLEAKGTVLDATVNTGGTLKVDVGGTAGTVTLAGGLANVSGTIGNASVNNTGTLSIGDGGKAVDVTAVSGTLSVAAKGAAGVLTLNGGTATVGGTISRAAINTGALSIIDGGKAGDVAAKGGTFSVAAKGATGVLTLDGGTATVGGAITSATINTGALSITDGGKAGDIAARGGTLSVAAKGTAGVLTVGASQVSIGGTVDKISLTNAGSKVEVLAGGLSGNVVISDGAFTSDADASSGTVNLSGGRAAIAGTIGDATVSGGLLNVGSTGTAANLAISAGEIDLSGKAGKVDVTGGTLSVVSKATAGALTVGAGQVTIGGTVDKIGLNNPGGKVEMLTGGSSGDVTVSNGTFTSNTGATSGMLDLSGGSASIAGTIGDATVSGGVLAVGATGIAGKLSVSDGEVDIAGKAGNAAVTHGTLTVLDKGVAGDITLSAGTLTVARGATTSALAISDGKAQIDGTIGKASISAGELAISATGSSGALQLNGGNTTIDGAAASVTVNMGATLAVTAGANVDAIAMNGGTATLTGTGFIANVGKGSNMAVAAGSDLGNLDLNGGDALVKGTVASATVTAGSTLEVGTGGRVRALNVSDGLFKLDKDATAGGVTASGNGIASIDGTADDVVLNAGGVLNGRGSMQSLTVNNGGIVAPGHSIGTIHVNGDVTYNPGSIYRVEVDADGNSDSVEVGGTAHLNGGVAANASSVGEYKAETHYQILKAGSVVGVFEKATSNLAYLTPTLSYGPKAVELVMTRNDTKIADVASNGNQAAVGAALEPLAPAVVKPTPVVVPPAPVAAPVAAPPAPVVAPAPAAAPPAPVVAQPAPVVVAPPAPAVVENPVMRALLNQTAEGARKALDALGGEGLTGTQNAAMLAGAQFTGALGDQAEVWRQSPVRDHAWSVWATGFGASQTLSADLAIGAGRQSNQSWGGAAGIDNQITPDFLAGVSLGGSSSRFSDTSHATSGSLTAYHVGAYALLRDAANYLSAAVAYSHFDNDTLRGIDALGLSGNATAKFGSDQVSARLEIGRDLPLQAVTVTPFAAVELAQLQTGHFAETADGTAGPLALSGLAQTNAATTTALGLRFRHDMTLGSDTVLTPSLSLGWRHGFASDMSMAMSVAALPGAFRIRGAESGADGLQVKAGADLLSAGTTAIYVRFDGDFASGSQTVAGKAGIRLAF